MVVYTYTGNDYTNTQGSLFSTSDHVTLSLTFAAPLGANFSNFGDGPVTPTSFTAFDGVDTITSTSYYAPFSAFYFSTDGTGQIIDWSVTIFMGSGNDIGNPADFLAISSLGGPMFIGGDQGEIVVSNIAIDFGEIFGHPGTWSGPPPFHWIGSSDTWSTAADWSTGVVPGAGDPAFIDAFGNYTVTSPSNVTVSSLFIDSGATLAVAGSTFDVTGDITGSGAISLQGQSTLDINERDGTQVSFTGLEETVRLHAATSYITSAVSGFGEGDAFDVSGMPFIPGLTHLSFAPGAFGSGGVLTLSEGSQIVTIPLSGTPWDSSKAYSVNNFAMTTDGGGGTLIEYSLDNRVVYIVTTVVDQLGNKQTFLASGMIVGPDTVLTAAHVIPLVHPNQSVTIGVYPGYDGYNGDVPAISPVSGDYVTHANGPKGPNGLFQHLESEKITPPLSSTDFGVIDFSTPLTSYLPTGTPLPSIALDYPGGTVSVVGYPNPSFHDGTQHSATGTVQVQTFGQLGAFVFNQNGSLTLPVFPGDSGGPMFAPNGSDVGIESTGTPRYSSPPLTYRQSIAG